MIYLLTAIGLSPGGCTHLRTNNTQNNTINNRRTQKTTNVGRVRTMPRLCEFYVTTEKKARKNLSQSKKSFSQVKKNLSQSTVYILPKHPHITTPPHPHPHIHTHTHYKTPSTYTHTHTLQNNINPPQYKLKQNTHKKCKTMGRKNST